MNFNWQVKDFPDLTIFEQIKNTRQISGDFLKSSFSDLPDTSLMKDLNLAADRIIEAVKKNQKIMIFGHDDLDGITSTYILFDFLNKIGSQKHFYHIPNRDTDNHGMQKNFIRKIAREAFSLLITVDGGISDFGAVRKISELGCDVIISDHHLVQNEVPRAYAVVNPKQADCSYPYKMLAGVGIIYMLLIKLAEKLNITLDKNYIFWVAIGSVADKVPMTGVNRILIKKVLDEWSGFNDNTLKIILNQDQYPVNHTSRMGIIRHIIRLLSNGRKPGGMNFILELLLKPLGEKEKIFQKLQKDLILSENRIVDLRIMLGELASSIKTDYYIYSDNPGKIPLDLLGFSAAYLSSSLKIPVIMLAHKKDVVTCEARCTEGFSLIEAFKYCRETLIQYGGHIKAAGFTARPENIPHFKEKFVEYVHSCARSIRENKVIRVDAVLYPDNFDSFIEFLQTDFHFLQPYGEENPTPYYLIKNYSRNYHSGKLKIENSNILTNDINYDVVLKFNGSSLHIVDFEQSGAGS